MRWTTIRKVAGAVGAVIVVVAPALPVKPELRQIIADIGAALAYFGHAPDVKSPPADETPAGETNAKGPVA